MSPEENKALIRRATDEFWNNPNQEAALAAVAEFYAPDFIDHVHPRDRSSDLEDVKQIYTSWRASFPDWHFTLETVMAEGDVVAIQGTAHGTHRGAFMGIAPTGKEVTVTATEVFRIAQGKIVEFWANMDELGMLRQLGVIPSPGQVAMP